MLEELAISGLGVVDRSEAQFAPGFTVLTGETGAGKTMIVTSLRLLAGGRADAGRVRTGSDRATVEGRFRVPAGTDGAGAALTEILESSGAELDEDGTVIAVRTVNADGRSRAHLGGRSVPVGVLGQATNTVLTIHGQNDQLRLLRPDRQRAALDAFAGGKVARSLADYRRRRDEWVALLDQLDERRANHRELAQEADRLRFGIEEIAAVDPQPGEDNDLVETVRRLTDLEDLRGAATDAHNRIAGDQGGDSASVVDGLGRVRELLTAANDSALRDLVPRISEALAVVTDVGDELGGYLGGLPADADDLERLLSRQAELKALVRKYAPDVDGVIAWHDDAQRRLADIDDPQGSIDDLAAAVDIARERVAKAAAVVHKVRRSAAKSMATKVSAELAGLAMGDAALAVEVRIDTPNADDRLAIEVDGQRAHAGPDGVDIVEFSLVPHEGAAPLPIAKSASGGELSRVMLAMEVVLAEPSSGSVMVFDEVDAGVGGRAAVEIGRRLARLSRGHQVIVVTHLPQVAAFADHHLLIGKSAGGTGAGSKTKGSKSLAQTSTVRTLDREERIAELARMLAGLGDSDTGRAHAEELLATAEAESSATDSA